MGSELIDVDSATSWGDLPPEHWQQAALRATTAPGELEETIVVASRAPETDEFIYVRCSPDSALQLMQRLAEALDGVHVESHVTHQERKLCGRIVRHDPHDHGPHGSRWCNGDPVLVEQDATTAF